MNAPRSSLFILLSLAFLSCVPLSAQVIAIDSGGYTLNNQDNATPLATGDLILFGYYSNATVNDPFAGTFISLTGPNTTEEITAGTLTGNPIIGQDSDPNVGAGDGTFAYNVVNLNLNSNQIPANGTIMAFQFYNGTSVATSTYYAAAADLSFASGDPADTALGWYYDPTTGFSQSFSLGDTSVVWDGGSAAAGYTSLPLTASLISSPEPATLPLLAGGIGLMALWRRTQRSRA